MVRNVTGIDIGSRTSEIVRGFYKGRTFHVTGFAVSAQQGEDVEDGWAQLAPAFKPTAARVALTGRDVNVRYSRVPRVPDWQLRNLMRFEVADIGDQSGADVASDFNLLPDVPEVEGEDVVLLALARERLLEEHRAGLEARGGSLDCFTPASVALYNAWLRHGVVEDDVVLLANIGYDNVDVVISRGPDLLFARNLSGGARLFDEALAQRFDVDATKVQRIKHEMTNLAPGAQHATPNHERASRAALGAAGQLLSLLQSTVLFCKSQVKVTGLKLDRVLLCGGGAALEGLTDYLAAGMAVPVDLFDPFRVVDTDALSPEAADLLETYKLESVVALGLATMASDKQAYSLEILPRQLARRREFWGKSAWLIAAGVLALGYLGFSALDEADRFEKVRAQNRTLSAQLRRAVTTHNEAVSLIEENERNAALVGELQAIAGTGEQTARTLCALAEVLPGDFWVTQLTAGLGHDEELGVTRGTELPLLSIKGSAREGAESPARLHQELTQALQTRLPAARMNQALLQGSSGHSFSIDLTLFVPPDPGESGESGDDGEDDASEAGGEG